MAGQHDLRVTKAETAMVVHLREANVFLREMAEPLQGGSGTERAGRDRLQQLGESLPHTVTDRVAR